MSLNIPMVFMLVERKNGFFEHRNATCWISIDRIGDLFNELTGRSIDCDKSELYNYVLDISGLSNEYKTLLKMYEGNLNVILELANERIGEVRE